jgi:hypothetical protein
MPHLDPADRTPTLLGEAAGRCKRFEKQHLNLPQSSATLTCLPGYGLGRRLSPILSLAMGLGR